VINLPGCGEVFIRDSGGTPPDPAVLLLHGWTASADLNFPVYARLAESYRVIALDLRGHGCGKPTGPPYGNPRVLHRPGEKPQVTRSAQVPNRFRCPAAHAC